MPTPALPVSWPTPLPGTVPYRREYRDVLGRAMTGTVTITGTARTDLGEVVVPAAAVTVKILDGVLAVDLPPDTYEIVANLRTVDGTKAGDLETVVLE